jgi:hypothetical protein
MKVICINNIEIIKHDNPYIKSREYHWKVLNIGDTYTVTSIHSRGKDKHTFFIQELFQFIPAELFMSIQQWREQQINKII